MLRGVTLCSRSAGTNGGTSRRWASRSVFGAKGIKTFWLEPGADRKFTSIFWGEHMFDENMIGANDKWWNPLQSHVPSEEDFGIEAPHAQQPPGAFPGINREWKGFKPSKVTSGYYGGGLALRDTWGPDAEAQPHGGQARPEVIIDRVSVDFFLDEFSVPLNEENTVMESCRAKHTSCLRVNVPQHDNQLDRNTLRTLNNSIRCSTHAPERRITMIGACQNGKTEWFSKGLPLGVFAEKLRWLVEPPVPPSEQHADPIDAAQVERLAEILLTKRNVPNQEAESNELAVCGALHSGQEDEGASGRLLESARRQADWLKRQAAHQQDPTATVHSIASHVRDALKCVYNAGRGDSPTISFVNGKAHNVGAGLALLTNYAALRNEAEITFSSATSGATPLGGLTRLLRDDAVSLKYPGLAEYMMLTGDAVHYGDAKRLGWTAVHAPTDVHLNERMLHDYMNMHGPGDSGNARRILHSALFNDVDHAPSMDRCNITAAKASWIEQAFHEKKSLDSIYETLQAMAEEPSSEAETSALVDEKGATVASRDITKQQWATYVHAVMKQYSPSAMTVSLAMIQKARAEQLDLADCMALEFRCFMKMITRKDFMRAQVCTAQLTTTTQVCIDNEDAAWPAGEADWNMEAGCPNWEPNLSTKEALQIVNDELEWVKDGTTELDLGVEAEDKHVIRKAVWKSGVDIVEGLGSEVASEDNAWLPDGVNVYKMARHPVTGVVGSSREAAIPQAQIDYKEQRLREASERLRRGEGRLFDNKSGALGDYEETPRERSERLGKLRWDEARLTAERYSNPETAYHLANRIDPGGEPILSPDGLNRHGLAFSPRIEAQYGEMPDHNSSTLTHFYSPSSGLPPKKVRDWGTLERFSNHHTKEGTDKDQLAKMILAGDF